MEKQKSFSVQLSSAGNDQGEQTNNFFPFHLQQICVANFSSLWTNAALDARVLGGCTTACSRVVVVVVVAVASRIWPLICSV